MNAAERVHSPLPPSDTSRSKLYLYAGQVFASLDPCEVSTVMGSCAGVLLVDPALRIGGASHYVLPLDDGGRSARFGNGAIALLVGRMLALGSRKHDLVAKVFGGASMLSHARPGAKSLGEQNVDVARQALREHGIPIAAEDV